MFVVVRIIRAAHVQILNLSITRTPLPNGTNELRNIVLSSAIGDLISRSDQTEARCVEIEIIICRWKD